VLEHQQDRQTNRQTGRQTGRQTQTDRHKWRSAHDHAVFTGSNV